MAADSPQTHAHLRLCSGGRRWKGSDRGQGAEVTPAHPEVVAGGGRMPRGKRRFPGGRRTTLPRSRFRRAGRRRETVNGAAESKTGRPPQDGGLLLPKVPLKMAAPASPPSLPKMAAAGWGGTLPKMAAGAPGRAASGGALETQA